ncbi:hypothetical protein BSK56_33445 [Paenibacillus borealis]|uniref:Uncharacterized protein n=1 Tax=Paenibacillus borealis TaxID=160799 RepID=A0ABX3GQL2_PAEBO|nr:hypothetical protein [Paenibacillus borealis]OMD34829.1 hypothetical protein BSK56_33445 [Paenibacillus borealis]
MDMQLTDWEELQSNLFRNTRVEQTAEQEAIQLYEVNTTFYAKVLKKCADAFSWKAIRLSYSLNLYRGGCWLGRCGGDGAIQDAYLSSNPAGSRNIRSGRLIFILPMTSP